MTASPARLLLCALFAIACLRADPTQAAQPPAPTSEPSAAVLFDRGLALARLGKLTEAASVFKSASHLFPRDVRFPLELAGVAYRRQKFSLSKKYLHEALRLDPANSYGNDFLATLYLLDGNLPAALRYWNRLHKPLIQTLRFAPRPPLNDVLRERAFDISPGQVFTLDRFRITEANLDRLDILTDLHFDLSPRDDQNFDLTVRSLPIAQPLSGWLGRVLPMVRGLPYETLDLDFYNLHQRGMDFTSLGRWDPNKRRIALSLSRPLHDNPRSEYRYFFDARDEIWDLRQTYRSSPGGLDGLQLRKAEAGADFEFGLTGKLQWTLGGRVDFRQFRNGNGSSFFSKGWTAQLRNRFDYLLWDWPDRRLRVNAWAELGVGRIFTAFPSRLVSTQAGLKGVWFPQARGDTYSIAASFHAGETFGNAPLDQLFMLGMERDTPQDFWLRGDVGTVNGRKGSAPMGREYALSQTDLKRRIFEAPFLRLDAGPFFDSGWIGDPSHQFGSRQWLYDTGIEGKLTTLGNVKLTVVYGRDLRDGRGVFYTAVSR